MTSVLMRAFQLRKIIQYQLHSASNFDVFLFNFKHVFWSSHHSNCLPPILLFAWHRDNHNFVTVLLIPFLASIGYALHLRRAAWFNKPCSIELGKGSVKQAIHALYDSCNKNVICAGNPVLIPVIFWIEFCSANLPMFYLPPLWKFVFGYLWCTLYQFDLKLDLDSFLLVTRIWSKTRSTRSSMCLDAGTVSNYVHYKTEYISNIV